MNYCTIFYISLSYYLQIYSGFESAPIAIVSIWNLDVYKHIFLLFSFYSISYNVELWLEYKLNFSFKLFFYNKTSYNFSERFLF